MTASPRSAASRANCSRSGGTVAFRRRRRFGPPTIQRCPSTSASAPCPGMARNEAAGGTSMRRSCAVRRTARATGCSESRSTAAATRRASMSEMPSAALRATTRCCPSVRVPVLSKTTSSSRRASSRPRRSRTRSPARAASVVEMAMTRGIASPSACGHAITSTVTTLSAMKAPGAPAIHQPTAVAAAAAIATNVRSRAARRVSTLR